MFLDRVRQSDVRPGLMLVEAMAGIALLTVIAGAAYAAIAADVSLRRQYAARQAAAWAAAGQLQRIQMGASDDSRPPEGILADDLVVTAQRVPGAGQWKAFDHVVVTAEVRNSRGKPVSEQVSGYAPRRAQP
jgi:hypothetical protein